jgi:hypothetical protein
MIAVLRYKVIGISMILTSHIFNKCPKLGRMHVYFTQIDRSSVYKSRALPWLHFKYSTGWEVMSSKSIFLTMYYSNT